MTKVRKYKTYTTLYERLRKLGIHNPGKHATYLLDVFVFNSNQIIAANARCKGLLRNQEFTEWRAMLQEKFVIAFTFHPKTHKPVYRPGGNIVDLINKEITLRKQISTKDESVYTYDVIYSIESELQMCKNAIRKLIEMSNPPFTEKKYLDWLQSPTTPVGELKKSLNNSVKRPAVTPTVYEDFEDRYPDPDEYPEFYQQMPDNLES